MGFRRLRFRWPSGDSRARGTRRGSAGWGNAARRGSALSGASSLFSRARLTWAAVLLLLAGCHTTPEPMPPVQVGPGWVVRQGQARWLPQRAGMVIAGEIIYASHPDGSFVIEFGKPPLPLVAAQYQAGRWQALYPTFQKQATGRGPLPANHLWLVLPAALRGEPVPEGVEFDRLSGGRWHLENPRTGEYIEGFLLPPS